ncbi:MAG: ThuA domain-containing protein [Verrucomicrobia bacterium]|nr:ThuA domain-containing protein [Verrucomicrobiota bacterium]
MYPTRLLSLLVVIAAVMLRPIQAAPDSITYLAGPSGPGAGRHLVFLTGDEEYRSEEGLPMLAKILSQRHGFRCTVLFALDPDGTINPDNNKSVPGSEALDTADGIVLALRFRQWPDDAMKRFAAAVARGVPIVGLRTATHAFRFPADSTSSYKHFNDFGREVLGENWVSHWGANRRGATRGIIEPGAESDPILRGVSDIFGDSGVYETHPVAGAKILARGQVLLGMKPTDAADLQQRKKRKSDGQEQGINDPMMPIAWTRLHESPGGKPNRVFCTTMGAATDLTNEGLRRMVVNAVLWGFEIEIPAKTDVRYVDDFAPTPYAFKGYRRGLKPDDHALGKVLRAGASVLPAPAPTKKS